MLFDVWFIGDQFLKQTFNAYTVIQEEARKNNKTTCPYLQEYYNVDAFFEMALGDVKTVTGRVVNTLIDTLNRKQKLPRFLVVVLNKDIINDIDVSDNDVAREMIKSTTNWIVKQFEIILHRKRAELLDKKPGAVYTGDPIVIFTHMIRCIKFYTNVRNQQIFSLRPRFNDVLNDAVACMDM